VWIEVVEVTVGGEVERVKPVEEVRAGEKFRLLREKREWEVLGEWREEEAVWRDFFREEKLPRRRMGEEERRTLIRRRTQLRRPPRRVRHMRASMEFERQEGTEEARWRKVRIVSRVERVVVMEGFRWHSRAPEVFNSTLQRWMLCNVSSVRRVEFR